MTALEEYENYHAQWLDATRNPTYGTYLDEKGFADAAIESMKCCGNCRWLDYDDEFFCGEHTDKGATMPWHWRTHPKSPCHFTPSRWAERC